MDIELRYCNKCLHKTLQAKDVFSDFSFIPAKMTKVWYCPNCATQWKPTKIDKDVDVNEI